MTGFARVAAALAAAILLPGCMPSLELPGSGPQAPSVTVTVNTTVNGERVRTETREGEAAPGQAGASDESGAEGDRALPSPADDVARPADPERAAAIDRAVQALNALSDVELQEVCAVMCPVRLVPK